MLEVESKAEIVRTEDQVEMEAAAMNILARVEGMGAQNLRKVEQWDLYLNHPCKDFGRTDEAFRIRAERKEEMEDWDIRMTYKGPMLSDVTKARVEREIELKEGSTIEGVQEMFSSVGLEVAGEVKKNRWILSLDDVVLSIDMVEGLGTYLEVEIMSENLTDAECRILDLLDILELTERERKSYLELIFEG